MAKPKDERELRILSTLSFVVNWIQTNKELIDEDFRTLKRLFPEQYEFAIRAKLEDIIEINNRFRDSKIYGKQIEILLSPQGIQWLEKAYQQLHDYAKLTNNK